MTTSIVRTFVSADVPDEAIRNALQTANIPALLATVLFLGGDHSLMDGSIRLTGGGLGELDGGIDDAAADRIRAAAFELLTKQRDGGNPPQPPSEPSFVRRIMDLLANQPVSDDYVALLTEEMALDGDLRTPSSVADVDPAFGTVIIGAGLSGLLMALRLKQAGLPFMVIEKNADVGGTWFENIYPGCRVDTEAHFYAYSFAPNVDWSGHFAAQGEVLAYLRKVTDEYDLRPHIKFECEVDALTWDEQTCLWTVNYREGGQTQTREANAVVSAVGQLNRLRYPDIVGLDAFEGQSVHTSAWDKSLDLSGKRVAVIGTGASAFQLVPAIAEQVEVLDVYQRSAPWIFPTSRYHDPVEDGQQWLLKAVPSYASWYRLWLFWNVADAMLPFVTVDPDWPHLDRSANAVNETLREMLSARITDQLQAKPELVDRCVPDYPPLSKRLMRDNGSWCGALCRDNVNLIGEKISAITPTGVVTEDGGGRDYDVIVYATGFRASEFYAPMTITGRGGVDLNDVWRGEPQAYLGITIPDFPNFFSLYGPNTNIAHGASITFMSECGARYVLEGLTLLATRKAAMMDVKRDVVDEFVDLIDRENRLRAWGMPQVVNWYKNASGRVTQVWPLPFSDYWRRTSFVDFSDYNLSPRPHAELSAQAAEIKAFG